MGAGCRVPVGDGHVMIYRHRSSGADTRRCLIVPPFGIPARWLTPLSAAVAELGLEAISFDARDHVGAGSGEITDYRVSQVAEDCGRLIDELEPTCVLAVSLGARGALRALAQTDASPDAVLVTPVVEVRPTLERILDRDWFAAEVSELPELMPVVDHEVRSTTFRADCLDHQLLTSDDAVEDLVAATGRVHLIAGSSDPWIDRATVAAVAGAASDRRAEPVGLEIVEAHDHLIHEDPDLAMRMIGAAVEAIATLDRREEVA